MSNPFAKNQIANPIGNKRIVLEMNFIVLFFIFSNYRQRLVYEQWRGLARTIANKYLPLEIPQEFPSRREQAIDYTHCCAVVLYLIIICHYTFTSLFITININVL